jgi:hypothetical protein
MRDMLADLLTMLVWTILLLAGVGVTSHLYRHMGVLTASQGTIMSLAALVDVFLLKHGLNEALSWLVAVAFSVALSLLHLPVLLQTKAALLLVLTAISQLVLVEVWYAVPQFTGGSSGILLPEIGAVGAFGTLLVIVGAGVAYLYLYVSKPQRHFNWMCVKALGPKAEAFGVPAVRFYALGFAIYGLVLGAAGITATRLLGYLTISSFGLTWALATVMIVLAFPKRPVFGAVLLSLTYCAIRVILRQSVYASVTASAAFEILFPVVLLTLMHANARRLLVNTHSREI